MSSGWFITGTDTGVGKTAVAAGVVHCARAQAKRVAVMKPVASGCVRNGDQWRNDDALALIEASGVDWDYELVNPYAFEPPVAPHLAAMAARETISIDHILSAFSKLREQADVTIVEGVGGFRVPLADFDTADMAVRMALPVVLVVGMRLGSLNHALLTAEAIRARGLVLAGWVANCIDPAMPLLGENIDALKNRLDAPCLGIVPSLDAPLAVNVAVHLHLPAN